MATLGTKDSGHLDFWRQRLSPFRIDRSQLVYVNNGNVVATGGFGCVRKAIYQTLTCHAGGDSPVESQGSNIPSGMAVAVKALQACGDIDIDRLERRFIREAYVWSQLKHENILEFLGFHFSHSDGVVEALLVCPWFENGESVVYLKRHQLSTVERLRLLLDAAEGLHYLHSRDPPICHGDIKGANFLINDDGRGALCDFGAAHELGDMFQEIVSKSAQRCTVRWTSPERLDTDGPPTTYSDIWSWGWLVWEIMTEKPPFNLVNNMSAVIYHIIMLKLPACDSEARFAELPLLSRLIQSCWGSEPDTRPSIFSCLKELKHILSQFGTHPSFNQREQSAQSTILAKSPGPVLEVNHPDPRAHEKKGSLHDAPPPDVESVDTVTKQQKTDPMNSPSAESLEKSLIQPRYVYDYGHLVTPNVPPASEPSSSPNLPQRNAEIAPKYSFVSRALPRPSTTTRQPKLKRPFTDLSVQPPSLPAVGNEFNLAFLDFEQSGLADGPETSPSAGPSRLAGEGDSEESSEVTTERPIKRRKLQSQAVGFDDVDNELDDAEGQVVDPPELSSPVHYVQANSFQVVYPPRRALAFSGAFELGSSPLVGEEPTTRSDKPVLSLKKRCRRRASPGAVFRRASKSTRSSNGVVRFRETEIEVYHSMPDQGGAATRQAIILETQQLVAVKLLSSLVPPSLGQVSSVKGGFLRWMKKVPKLESPRIAAPMGYVFFKNVPAILSQWNTSGNVTDFLQNNPNIDRQRLLRQVVEGLSYLHELTEPVLHSNIKPSNILIDDAGNAMLGDVGVLAFLEQCSPDHRLQGKAEDTRWTAPEVLEGQARDKSSDVYSLGCVALFILKDKLPYGNQASDIAVVKAIARGVMPFDDSQMSTLHDVWKDCLSRETYLRPGIEDVQRSVGSW